MTRTLLQGAPIIALVLGMLAAGQAATMAGVGAFFYCSALAVAGVFVARSPFEGVWVGFTLLAITAQIYPIEIVSGTSMAGSDRPFILVVVVMGIAVAANRLLSKQTANITRTNSGTKTVTLRIRVFFGVFLMALALNYFRAFQSPGVVDVVRDCSGLLTFVAFFILGMSSLKSARRTVKSVSRFIYATTAYSVFLAAKFFFLSVSSGVGETAAGFGYSQRDPVLFCGVALVVLIVHTLSGRSRLTWREAWPFALALMLATLLSGSRSVFACEVFVPLIFLAVWRPKSRLPIAVSCIGLCILAVVGVLSLQSGASNSSRGGFASYVSNRFFSFSTEDMSLLSRISELQAVENSVRKHPFLGSGPLASYSFYEPIFGWKKTTFLDSGLGYLLMKTGIVGTIVFFWFAAGWLKMVPQLGKACSSLAISYLAAFTFYLVYLPFGPSFFQFQHCWFIGLLSGQAVYLTSALRTPGFMSAQGGLHLGEGTV